MPTLIERARVRLADALLGEEKQKLQESFRLMQQAYYEGPFVLPPGELLRQLGEVDPWLIQDYLQQLGWDTVGYTFQTSAERERAVQESRRLFKYSPLAQWAIWLWTSWGLGESVQITLDVEEADGVWQEFWAADRNQPVLAADCIHDLSHWLLVDGNQFLAFYASTVDGETTIAVVDPTQITEIVTDPNNSARPLFYKREWTTAKGESRTWYYPDWLPFLTGELDEEYQGNSKTLAQEVLPAGAYRADLGRRMGVDVQLGGEEQPRTTVCMLHLHHNHKERGELWGWPILSTDTPWLRAHKRFIEARLAVAEAKAAFVRRYRAQGGSRAVAGVISTIASKLSQSSSGYDTNPPPAPASTEVMNQAVEATDLPMTTGAGDARTDNELFSWYALLGAGLFPASAGLDLQRYATALEMDKTQSMLFTGYQTYWSAQFQKVVRIVVGMREKYGKREFGEYSVSVSVDSFSLADFPAVASTLGALVGSMLTPLLAGGVIPARAGGAIAAALWRITLQALGVSGAADLTSDEAFGLAEPGAAEEFDRILKVAIENYRAGKIGADQLAEFALAEWAEVAARG